MTEKLKVLDLFSGIGGFSFGLERSGFETVAFCEIDKHCQKVLNKHWPDVPVYNDVKGVTSERFKSDGISGIDVITGGFPCADISIAGKGKGIQGEQSGLWFEYHRIISDLRPKYAIVENVSALLGRGLSTILGGLAMLGYDAAWTIFDSQYFGTPQRRRRVYIFAVRNGISTDADIFRLVGRSSWQCSQEVESLKKINQWNFKAGKGKRNSFAYYTRQRSDEFACIGLSSTLAKRDYKSYTDIIVQNGIARRVTPVERLRLQGFPDDWMDGLQISDSNKFRMGGMSVNVVSHLGELLKSFNDEFDNV